MKSLIRYWMAQGRDELRVVGSLATAAYVTGGAVGSLAIAVSWVLQRHGSRVPS